MQIIKRYYLLLLLITQKINVLHLKIAILVIRNQIARGVKVITYLFDLDINVCMPTSSKRNCTVSLLNFHGQYKCLSRSDIKVYFNKHSIEIALRSIDISNTDSNTMFIYFISYTHYTKLELNINIHQVIISSFILFTIRILV